MTTYNLTQGGSSKVSIAEQAPIFVVERILDFSAKEDIGQVRSVNGGGGTIQNDLIPLIAVPAKTLVVGVHYEILVASANLDDLDIGDGTDPDGWHDGIDLGSTGSSYKGGAGLVLVEAAPNTVLGYTGGKYYAAADTIDLKQNTDATVVTGKISVKAIMFDLSTKY